MPTPVHDRWRSLRDEERGQAGESLIELLMAVTIMSIAVVAVVGAFVTFIVVSGTHRSQTTAGAGVRSYAEQVTTFVADGGYASCATTASYSPGTVGYAVPSGFSAATAAVAFWTGSAWSTSCGTDTGLQRVTLTVASAGGRADESAVLVLRRPCGKGSGCSA